MKVLGILLMVTGILGIFASLPFTQHLVANSPTTPIPAEGRDIAYNAHGHVVYLTQQEELLRLSLPIVGLLVGLGGHFLYRRRGSHA